MSLSSESESDQVLIETSTDEAPEDCQNRFCNFGSDVRLSTNASKPWIGPIKWNPHGADDDEFHATMQRLLVPLWMAMVLVPFNWAAFNVSVVKGIDGLAFAMAIIADTFFVVANFNLGMSLFTNLRLGSFHSRFKTFPFRLGAKAEITLSGLESLRQYDEIEIEIRCIDEKVVVGDLNRVKWYHSQIYSERRTIMPSTLSEKMLFKFDLPDDKSLVTALERSKARYWELCLRAAKADVIITRVFLIPVY
jgi:hypothetical protein